MLRAALLMLISVTAYQTPASALPVSIRAGESVTVRLASGEATVIDRGAAPSLSAFESRTLQMLQGIVLPPGTTVAPAVPLHDSEAPQLSPGQVRLTFRNVPAPSGQSGVQSLLVLENGYGQSMMYRAVMTRGDRSSPTDVCEVMPGKFGFEHWPYQIDALQLSDFELVPPSGGEARCR